jgi:hypothetical protein
MAEGVGFVKVVADATHNELLGAHMIDPEVTELLPAFTLAQQWDLTADEIARNIFAHPTLSEAMKEAIEGIAGHMINLKPSPHQSPVLPSGRRALCVIDRFGSLAGGERSCRRGR